MDEKFSDSFTQAQAEQEASTLTFSGKRLCILDPAPDSITLVDVAIGLSRAPRWNGQSHRWLSTAQHSVEVYKFVRGLDVYPCREVLLAALFHDASEAYLADVPKPFKLQLPDYCRMEHRLMLSVATRFGFRWPVGGIPQVHYADQLQLAREMRDLFTPSRLYLMPELEQEIADEPTIQPLGAEAAGRLFLETYDEIMAPPRG
jgi:hypothetical protein